MDDEVEFLPARRAGLAFQAAAATILVGASVWGVWRALNTALGPLFVLYLIPAVVAALLLPLLAYRAYSLWWAYYRLSRDGIRLHWGLRGEVIPIDQVLWVRAANDWDTQSLPDVGQEMPPGPAGSEAPAGLTGAAELVGTSRDAARVEPAVRAGSKKPRPSRQLKLPLPWLRWPGGVLGQRKLPDGVQVNGTPAVLAPEAERKAGQQIEYLADSSRRLALIATARGIFAVSPADLPGFISAYQRFSELGATTPLPASSVFPSFLIARVWLAPLARALILAGFLLALALLAVVAAAIPSRQTITLGFTPTSQPVPAIRLMMLPLMNALFFLVDFFLGLFFFRYDGRRTETGFAPGTMPASTAADGDSGASLTAAPATRVLSYLLWGSSVVTALLFSVAVYIILIAI